MCPKLQPCVLTTARQWPIILLIYGTETIEVVRHNYKPITIVLLVGNGVDCNLTPSVVFSILGAKV